MNKCSLFLIIVFYILNLSGLSANGGGTYAISATMRSSDPIFREIKDITLLSEKLYIKLNSDRADVTVKYILVNNSDTDYKNIDYAFPIDYVSMDPPYTDRWSDTSLKNLNFLLNGESLPYKFSEEKIQSKESIIENTHTSYTNNFIRRWFYTKLNIEKNSFVNLEVTYSVQSLALGDGDDPTELWYLTSSFPHHFRYDFSPAQYWGDGIIRDFYVQIDNSALNLAGDLTNINADYEYAFKVTGLEFQKTGNIYEYRIRNFKLKDADPIQITYLTPQFTSNDIIISHAVTSNMYTVKVSSENKQYPASNLSDSNLETAWVPNNRVNDWIEFTFKKPFDNFAGIIILNGFLKSEKAFYENNRIKSISVDMKQVGKDWVSIPYWGEGLLCPLEDFKYKQIYFENLFNLEQYNAFNFYDIQEIDPDLAIEKIRINIKEVYPGTKYDDTCISEILFLKR